MFIEKALTARKQFAADQVPEESDRREDYVKGLCDKTDTIRVTSKHNCNG